MPIKILAPDIAAKIAAGEVVERPSSVAKELIENSLDAGATEIRVELREGGQRLLRVADNGQGLPADEASLAFQRHATSKLSESTDLDHISTLGFRGEALYSIAAVSQVTFVSRTHTEQSAVRLRLEGGDIVDNDRSGAPVGTSVTVEHLFHNVPARRKFLRKPATEAGRISAVVQRYALARPDCRFVFVNEGRETFRTSGSGELFDVLVQVRGLEQARQMVAFGDGSKKAGEPKFGGGLRDEIAFMDASELPGEEEYVRPLRVFGFCSLPSLTRANRAGIDLFVNHRYVEDRSIVHAVVQAYHTLLPVGRYPLAVVNVEIDPGEVDVNVHPQKTQIRFVDERAVFSAVQRSVRESIVQHAPIPGMTGERTSSTDAWQARRDRLTQAGTQTHFTLPAPRPVRTEPLAAQTDLQESREWAQPVAKQQEANEDSIGSATTLQSDVSGDVPKVSPGRKLPPLRVVGQVGALYIIAEGPQGVYLIDQHAAHERILYEDFMSRRGDAESGAVASQQILEPITLHVGHEVTGLVGQHLEELKQVGFQIEPFGGDSFLLRGVPTVLGGQDPQRIVEEIVSGLVERRNLVGEELEAQLVKMVCKKAAIKAGQQLSDIEMRELVRQLELCESPRTCPHGRPTMIQLSAGELEKAFGRI